MRLPSDRLPSYSRQVAKTAKSSGFRIDPASKSEPGMRWHSANRAGWKRIGLSRERGAGKGVSAHYLHESDIMGNGNTRVSWVDLGNHASHQDAHDVIARHHTNETAARNRAATR